MLNIVIPMAGRGSRFANAGYKDPKPLINVNDKRMIEVVINNLKPDIDHNFIFICQKEHIQKYNLIEIFENLCPKFNVITLEGITNGAAETVMYASEYINNSNPLMIANSDQWVDININEYLKDMLERNLDGSMLTMTANDKKWSYAEINNESLVTRVVEKEVISDEATVGIYNFKQGLDFCKHATYMIDNNLRSNGEFYVAPVYSFMADSGSKIGIFNIGSEKDGMYGLGIPEDLEYFLSIDKSKQATNF